MAYTWDSVSWKIDSQKNELTWFLLLSIIISLILKNFAHAEDVRNEMIAWGHHQGSWLGAIFQSVTMTAPSHSDKAVTTDEGVAYMQCTIKHT